MWLLVSDWLATPVIYHHLYRILFGSFYRQFGSLMVSQVLKDILLFFFSASDWFYGRPATSLQEGYIPANYVALAGGVANEE